MKHIKRFDEMKKTNTEDCEYCNGGITSCDHCDGSGEGCEHCGGDGYVIRVVVLEKY